MSCDKWVGPKVCRKFKDTPGYDTHCTLKSSVSVFSMHLFQDKRVATCVLSAILIIEMCRLTVYNEKSIDLHSIST